MSPKSLFSRYSPICSRCWFALDVVLCLDGELSHIIIHATTYVRQSLYFQNNTHQGRGRSFSLTTHANRCCQHTSLVAAYISCLGHGRVYIVVVFCRWPFNATPCRFIVAGNDLLQWTVVTQQNAANVHDIRRFVGLPRLQHRMTSLWYKSYRIRRVIIWTTGPMSFGCL
jgi:hypothetical protein